jgi:hypothetical protein
MSPMHRTSVAAAIAVGLTLGAGCGHTEEKPNQAEADKKGLDAAATTLKQHVALIAAYLPHVRVADDKAKYAPKRRMDTSKSMAFASDEVRHAANGARQKIDGAGPAKEIVAALEATAATCTNVEEETAADKCVAAVQKIEEAIKKAEAASAAVGGTVKFPHIAPESVTDEAKAQIAPFLKAKGPGPAEKTYATKRSDTTLSTGDLMSACQAASDETDAVATAFAKAEEPLRLVAVTHKLALEGQCKGLTATDNLHKDLLECKKKVKTPECKIVCGKAKAQVEDGLPAATFVPMEKDVADICKE